MRVIHAISALIALALCGAPAAAQMNIDKPPDTTSAPSKFRSADDGWFDVSGFLDEKYGFLPVVIPITEPAVGYGATAALAFLSQPLGQARAGFGRPDITIAGGLYSRRFGARSSRRSWVCSIPPWARTTSFSACS